MRLMVAVLLVFINSLQAKPEEGQAAAEAFLQDPTVKNIAAPNYQAGANHIGNMKYEREPEKHATWQKNQSIDSSQLEQKGATEAMQQQVGEQIIKCDRSRPRFDEIIDLKLIGTSEQFTENLEQELIADGNRERVVTETTKYSIKTCQNSRAAEEHQCISYLQNPTVDVTPAKYSHYWCSAGNHQPDDPRCRAKTYYNPARMYQDKIVKISPDVWVSECHALAARKECQVIKEKCLDQEPRVINGETIVRPCWKYHYTYACKYPVEISCDPLLKQGCSPLDSKCIVTVKQQDEDKCYIWEQKYQCPVLENKEQKTTKYVRPFCLEGECFNTDYAPNDEMLTSIAQLDVFAEMQQDVRSEMNYIFKGGSQGCNRLCLTFKDCCKMSGWGKDLGLVGCNDEEKQLAENRHKGLCVEVGTYCAEKIPITGICLRKKTNFCCFHSKLTKAIQQQGRRQLGMNFGSAEEPNCRGLTVEELSRIDFSKLNLTEAFSDLQPTLKNPAEMNQKLQQKLKDIQADFKSQMQDEK